MNKYELMFIVASEKPEAEREEIIKKMKSVLESRGGVVAGVDKMGMKRLAYPINFKNEGFYVLMNIEYPAQEVDATKKLMSITDGIIRHMFVRKDA